MNDVRIDQAGEFRCWKCGGKQFTHKRTFRAKAAVGVGALLTHKKLKCLACGEYNQTGNAQPFGAVWRWDGRHWKCIDHRQARCVRCAKISKHPPDKPAEPGRVWTAGAVYPRVAAPQG